MHMKIPKALLAAMLISSTTYGQEVVDTISSNTSNTIGTPEIITPTNEPDTTKVIRNTNGPFDGKGNCIACGRG